MSIRLTKRDGGRRVTSVLSESFAGRRSGLGEGIGAGKKLSGDMDHPEVKVSEVY